MAGQVGYIFLDLETTGLESDDQITEAAWFAWLPGKLSGNMQMFVKHTKLPSLWVASESNYGTRILPKMASWVEPDVMLSELQRYCGDLRAKGAEEVYLVGSNISFDDGFLVRASERSPYSSAPSVWRKRPYDYHLIDVETMAMQRCNLPVPPRTKDLVGLLGLEPDARYGDWHDALFDAHIAMLAFRKMIGI
jgi:DNA polymerase III epsilon subunit-like protein